MLITQTPCFRIEQIIKRGTNNIRAYPLYSRNSYLFFGARYAIWAGTKLLGINSSHNIIMPSYNCGTEIDPILDQKIQIKYYNIKRDMGIDLEDLTNQIDSNTAAILITHYLGFTQRINEIKNICNKKRLFLIEDCAHAFLSTYQSKNLGSFGDISVFSIRKTLPIPNGGALVVNNANLRFEKKQKKSSVLSTYFVSVELLKNRTQKDNQKLVWIITDRFFRAVAFLNYFFRLILRLFKKMFAYKGLALNHVNYWSREFNRDLVKWDISKLSEKIIRNIDYEKLKEKRRKNFEYLLKDLSKIKDIKLVFDKLPIGVCPLFFPIIVKDRNYYHQKFKKRGIATYPYWQYMHDSVPWGKFPDAVYLKQHVLGLPIHQDISFEHLEKIIEVLNNIKSGSDK
jgi:dTDP-4-amino-4,6-dideoxygalactose transaminase